MNEMYGYAPSAFGIIAFVVLGNLVAVALAVAKYVLGSLGYYTIADRRGIRNPWMAWLPVVDMWILGSIADQYRYVAKGEIRNRRKVILALHIVQVVLTLVLIGCYAGVFANFLMNLRALGYMSEEQVWSIFRTPLMSVMGVCGVMQIVAIVLSVFQYIAHYDLYASCDPEHKVLFTVLSILLPVTQPFFVFACRKKEYGMPPRKGSAADTPVQTAPTAMPEAIDEITEE